MLTCHSTYTGSIPVEAPCVAPDRLANLSADAIARLPVQHGNTAAVLGDFFTITGNAADAEIVIEGDCGRIKWLGAKWPAGG